MFFLAAAVVGIAGVCRSDSRVPAALFALTTTELTLDIRYTPCRRCTIIIHFKRDAIVKYVRIEGHLCK